MEKKKAIATGTKYSTPENTPTERNTVRTVTDTDPDIPDVLKEQRLQKLLKHYRENRERRLKKELVYNRVSDEFYSDVSDITNVLSYIIDSIHSYFDWILHIRIIYKTCKYDIQPHELLVLDEITNLFLTIAQYKDALLKLSEEYTAIDSLLSEAYEKEWEITEI
jgi:hypothetical protein